MTASSSCRQTLPGSHGPATPIAFVCLRGPVEGPGLGDAERGGELRVGWGVGDAVPLGAACGPPALGDGLALNTGVGVAVPCAVALGVAVAVGVAVELAVAVPVIAGVGVVDG